MVSKQKIVTRKGDCAAQDGYRWKVEELGYLGFGKEVGERRSSVSVSSKFGSVALSERLDGTASGQDADASEHGRLIERLLTSLLCTFASARRAWRNRSGGSESVRVRAMRAKRRRRRIRGFGLGKGRGGNETSCGLLVSHRRQLIGKLCHLLLNLHHSVLPRRRRHSSFDRWPTRGRRIVAVHRRGSLLVLGGSCG